MLERNEVIRRIKEKNIQIRAELMFEIAKFFERKGYDYWGRKIVSKITTINRLATSFIRAVKRNEIESIEGSIGNYFWEREQKKVIKKMDINQQNEGEFCLI